MEYLLIFAFEILGIAFHVMQKVIKLDEDHKGITRKQVFIIFWDEDWDTLIVSGLILIANLLIHYVIDSYSPDFRHGIQYYFLYAIGAAFMLGYLGQRAVYKWLGSAEKKIDSFIENKTK